MHLSSMQNMERFRDRHLAARRGERLRIVDLGSTDIGGCYRPLFDNPSWDYCGLDLAPGPNVDIVLKRPYHWDNLRSESVDVFISGQVLEHVEYFWITALEISRVLRPGGIACLIAPSGGYEHRYPVDCWRFYPDGMRALARFARLECLEAYTQWEGSDDPGSDPWKDTVLVLRKPQRPWPKALAVRGLQALQHRLLGFRLID
ncbi:MAG: methyltransferase domain-containing protein [Betaproteobacteria bacterium]|jgi:SAM-dependent methyltransferase|nr:methyltransferase domain-containing protein [Betaproteobacteria bacterium]